MTIQINIDKKTFAIGVLCITAAILFAANILNTARPAVAADSIKDRDYQAVTARMVQGGEGLYLVDNRTGQMAVFTYDVAAKTVQPKAVLPVTAAFPLPQRR